MPHIIRLRGPWEWEASADKVRITRRFHRPTGLEAGDCVWLTIDDVHGSATVALNGRRLGEIVSRSSEEPHSHLEIQRCPARFNLTTDLQPHNAITVEVTTPPAGVADGPGGLIGLVCLEIETSKPCPG
jgi:hypothetical protein